MHTTIVKLKEYSNKEVSLLTQFILTELLIVFGVINFITNVFLPVFYAIIVMLMFNMSLNNYKFFKKKYMTVIYIIVGLFVLITTLMEYIV